MTGVGKCADVRLVLGVYVLGAADPAERTLVRMHLAWCRDCREELAGLAGLPGLLRRVPAAEADELLTSEAGLGGRAPRTAGAARGAMRGGGVAWLTRGHPRRVMPGRAASAVNPQARAGRYSWHGDRARHGQREAAPAGLRR